MSVGSDGTIGSSSAGLSSKSCSGGGASGAPSVDMADAGVTGCSIPLADSGGKGMLGSKGEGRGEGVDRR